VAGYKGMELPEAVERGKGLAKVDGSEKCMFSNQHRTADRGWYSTLGFGQVRDKAWHKKKLQNTQ